MPLTHCGSGFCKQRFAEVLEFNILRTAGAGGRPKWSYALSANPECGETSDVTREPESERRRKPLPSGSSVLNRAVVIPQRNIHIDLAALGAEAEDYSLSIFAALGALLGGMNGGRMYSKVEALIVKDCNCVPNDLIGELANCFAD